MKFRIAAFLVFAISCYLGLSHAVDQEAAKKGKEIYKTKCAACHGDEGQGKPQIEKLFGVKMSPLAGKEVQSMKDDQLQKNILEGNGKMPAVKISRADAADLIAFLRTLPKK